MKLVRSLAGAVAAAALMAASGPVAAQEFGMKMANVVNAQHSAHEGMEVWANYIQVQGQGRIKTEIFPNGQLGNFGQLVEQVRLGTIENTFTTGGGISNVLPEIQAFDIPYMVKDDRVVEMMQLDPILLDFMRKEALQKTGMRMIGMSGMAGWRSFYTRSGPVKVATDIKGMKIRTIESALPMEHVKTLGGLPTPVPWQELYTSFATRVVDGTMNSANDIMTMNFQEFLKFGVLDRHTYIWGFWWVNEPWWRKLPADLQKVVLDGFYDLRSVANNNPKFRELGDQARFIKAGGKIHSPTAEEYKTFLPAREVVTNWYTGKYGDRWLTMMKESIARAEKAIEDENKRTAM